MRKTSRKNGQVDSAKKMKNCEGGACELLTRGSAYLFSISLQQLIKLSSRSGVVGQRSNREENCPVAAAKEKKVF
jgi:hypothetical protein